MPLKKEFQYDMVILAPSGNNKQPVCVVFDENSISFFIKNKKNEVITNSSAELDAEIFISHFYLCLRNENMEASFFKVNFNEKSYSIPPEFSYIISLNYSNN